MLDEVEGEDSPEYLIKLGESKEEVERNPNNETWKEVVTYHDLYVKNVQE